MCRPTPVLRRFDVMVFKDFTGLDRRQVPALNATVDFYLQGAALSPQNPVIILSGGSGDVLVYHLGALQVNDNVQLGVDPQSLMGVVSITPATSGPSATVRLSYGGPLPSVLLQAGTRLVLLSRRPFVYDDPAGETGTTSTGGPTLAGTFAAT